MTRTGTLAVVLLASLLNACASGGGTRAPVEERSARTAPAAPAPVSAPRSAASPGAAGVVVEALPDMPPPRVEALGEDAFPDEAAEPLGPDRAETQAGEPDRVALAAPARGGATQSLLAAASVAASAGEWDRAQAALERAVRLSPQDAELWRQLAYTHYRAGDLEQASAHAQRAVALAPEDAAGWQLVADIEAARGNSDAAARARARSGVR